MFTSVDTLVHDLLEYEAGNDHFAMYRVRNTDIGRVVLQLAAGKRPDGIECDDKLDELKSAAVKFVRDVMLSPTSDHFALLGVAIEAEPNVIRDQFRRLMGLVHPDTRPTDFPDDAATRVNRAYATLADADTRAAYTEQLFGTGSQVPAGLTSRSARAPDAGHVSSASFGARLNSLAQLFRTRSTLLWLAVLLIAPLGLWFASLFSRDTPTRLVEARPKLNASNSIALTEKPIIPETKSPADTTVSPPPTVVAEPPPKSLPEVKAIASQQPSATRPAQVKGIVRSDSSPGMIMSNQLSDRSLALTARTGARSAGVSKEPSSTAPSLAPTPASPDNSSRISSARDLAPNAPSAAVPPTPIAATSPPAVTRSETAERAESTSRVRTSDADEILVRFSNAYEAGSINGFAQLLSPAMSGRRQMLSEYERVFNTTRQRSIKFNQLKHTTTGERVATSGYATVTTVDQDNRTVTQRVFLEFEIGRERGEPRIERIANYVIH